MRDHDSDSRPTTDQCISAIAQILAIGVCRMYSRGTVLEDTPGDAYHGQPLIASSIRESRLLN